MPGGDRDARRRGRGVGEPAERHQRGSCGQRGQQRGHPTVTGPVAACGRGDHADRPEHGDQAQSEAKPSSQRKDAGGDAQQDEDADRAGDQRRFVVRAERLHGEVLHRRRCGVDDPVADADDGGLQGGGEARHQLADAEGDEDGDQTGQRPPPTRWAPAVRPTVVPVGAVAAVRWWGRLE